MNVEKYKLTKDTKSTSSQTTKCVERIGANLQSELINNMERI